MKKPARPRAPARPAPRPGERSRSADSASSHFRARGIATAVIARANREHPADDVLREVLKGEAGLAPSTRREAARMLFAFYRWMGWTDTRLSIAERLAQTIELSQRFRRASGSIAEAELLTKALPRWVGDQVKLTSALVRALQTEPKVWIRARLGKGHELGRKLGNCRILGSGRLSDALEYQGADDLYRTPEFEGGEIELQDLGSQVVGWLCDPQPGETWWDACAGEGGKTLHFSDLMRNQGLIWASDKAEWRLQRLKRRAGRAKVFNYRSARWDGGARLPTKTPFDGILVDAPCSGLGTWARNPHARWTTTMKDVQDLAGLQLQLLTHAAPALKPGGKLFYAVCTFTRAETIEVVKAFQKRFPAFEPLPLPDPLHPTAEKIAPRWLWPQDTGGNGMFVAAWRRKAQAAMAR